MSVKFITKCCATSFDFKKQQKSTYEIKKRVLSFDSNDKRKKLMEPLGPP